MKALILVCGILTLTGCLQQQASSTSNVSTPGTDPVSFPGSSPSAGFTGMVSAVDKSTVSNFGDTVNLTLSNFSGNVQSVQAGGVSLTFSQTGSNLQVTIPEGESAGQLSMTIQDDQSNTFGWNSGVGLTVQSGLQITATAGSSAILSNCPGAFEGTVDASGNIYCYGSSLYKIAPDGTTTTIPTSGFIDSVNVIGSHIYLIYYSNRGNTISLVRTDLAGNVDRTFSTYSVTESSSMIQFDAAPGVISDDGTTLYVAYQNYDDSLSIVRMDESGTVDATFGTAGIVTLVDPPMSVCTYPADGISYQCVWAPHARLRQFNNQLIFELGLVSSGIGGDDVFQQLVVLNQDGSTPANLPAYLTQTVNVSGQTYLDLYLSSQYQPDNRLNWGSYNIFVSNNQLYQMANNGTPGSLKRFNSDVTKSVVIDSSYFSNAPINGSAGNIVTTTAIADRDYHTALPYGYTAAGFNLGLPLNWDYQTDVDYYLQPMKMVDATPLPSGNVLALYLVTDGSTSKACFLIVGQDGAPIHANRARHFCQTISADAILDYQSLIGTNGETYSVQGSTYSYAIVTDKPWVLSVQVNEGAE